MMTVTAPTEDVRAYCKACRSVVAHAVVALKGRKPCRVQCRTCQDTHPYRAQPPIAKEARAQAHAPAGPLSSEAGYQSLIEGRDLSRTACYEMTHRYENSDLFNHERFGIGLVTRVMVDRKMEVLFPEGVKIMAHNR